MRKFEIVAENIRSQIDTRVLKRGDKIPSVRKMAEQFGVSTMTVVDAYRSLENEGVIESRPQSGYYVRPKSMHNPKPWTRLPDSRLENITLKTDSIRPNPHAESLIERAGRSDLIPFGGGLPDPEYFPSDELSLRASRIVRTFPNEVNCYSLAKGELVLREQLAKHMYSMNCNTGPDDIQVCTGATQAILIALRSVAQSGDTIAVESPGFFGFFGILQFLNLNVIEIPSSPSTGLQVDALEECLKMQKVSALLLCSSHSNPTGATIPERAKKKLCALCAEHSLPIIEDDTYGDITFESKRPKPLKFYSPETVIYIGNFTKILAPGYRISWIAGGKYSNDISRCFNMGVLATPKLTQLTIAAFLQDGGMKRHLRRISKQYEENVRFYQSEIARSFPDGSHTSDPSGGYFLWVELPDQVDSVTVAEKAFLKGISIAPGVIFSTRDHYRSYLRINCANTWTKEYSEAIKQLARIVSAESS